MALDIITIKNAPPAKFQMFSKYETNIFPLEGRFEIQLLLFFSCIF